MFILNLTYKKSIDIVEKYLSEHNTYLEKYYNSGNFICSGRKNPRTGGIILCNFDSLVDVKEAIKDDPFLKEGIADYMITEFMPTKYISLFKDILD
ncbi:YciI family protein [Peptostreptococcus equinus]|uniref:YciI family protein n=1 Tax=Peptostreptococcus equinus TaxID=3003601 RepID=A0ABY7JS20_9FIRM|nr:YciI family protein [Peptostreptococcus sp. CBA3647]WAW14963.1 YciI family protein [Peptostreptococcus sp. CBA3647]